MNTHQMRRMLEEMVVEAEGAELKGRDSIPIPIDHVKEISDALNTLMGERERFWYATRGVLWELERLGRLRRDDPEFGYHLLGDVFHGHVKELHWVWVDVKP